MKGIMPRAASGTGFFPGCNSPESRESHTSQRQGFVPTLRATLRVKGEPAKPRSRAAAPSRSPTGTSGATASLRASPELGVVTGRHLGHSDRCAGGARACGEGT